VEASATHKLCAIRGLPEDSEELRFDPEKPVARLPRFKMIYDVRSAYYQGFLSTKQGQQGREKKMPAATPSEAVASGGDAIMAD
jgi:hypothetical protein